MVSVHIWSEHLCVIYFAKICNPSKIKRQGWHSIFIYALLRQIICLRNAYLYSITPCLSVAYDLPKQQLAPILHSINFVLLSRRVKIFHLISTIIFCVSSSILNLISNKVKIHIYRTSKISRVMLLVNYNSWDRRLSLFHSSFVN
jgi:hypothetical protein